MEWRGILATEEYFFLLLYLSIVDQLQSILQVVKHVSLVLLSEISETSIDNACDKLQLLIADKCKTFLISLF